MLLLTCMLVIGLLAAIWGFMACFLPAQWDRLTEKMSFADHWSEASPKRLHPIIRFGNRLAGLVIFCGGCWFVYVAISKIYLVLTGRAAMHTAAPTSGALPNSSTPALNALPVFMIVAGIVMIIFPGKAVAVFGRFWPAGRSVKPSAAPKVMLFVRLFGAGLTLLAIMSLIH